MELFLQFQGQISTTRHSRQKFEYRRQIMKQLEVLKKFLEDEGLPSEHCFCHEKLKRVGDFKFLPLVTKECNKVVDLDITLLTHCEPGCSKSFPTGDIDNIAKVLIDSLRMAQNMNEIRDQTPLEGEEYFYSLLEDDQIIRNLKIEHQRLLFPQNKKFNSREIFALMKVTILPKFPYIYSKKSELKTSVEKQEP